VKRRIVVIGLTALSLLAAACGADDTQSSPPPSAPAASPTVPAAELPAVPWPGKAPTMSPVDAATATDWTNKANEGLASIDGLNGMWIAVSDPERGRWTAALGNAAAGGPPATLADHSQIGSVTKTFTATAILQQVAAGTLALDDTVEQVLPDVATTYPPAAALVSRH
jgi:CubicO group peptidase (beta-lactamase class C family)